MIKNLFIRIEGVKNLFVSIAGIKNLHISFSQPPVQDGIFDDTFGETFN